METAYICRTCGVQHEPTRHPPENCLICSEERQYVGHGGQQWLTYPELRSTHRNLVRLEEPGLFGIGMEPRFAINQRALLLPTERGNILWDCTPLLDNETQRMIEEMGGLAAIAISHPHYYSTIAEWSRAFGDVPVYIHQGDAQWVARRPAGLQLWEGAALALADGVTLINCGGHYEGSTVLHWRDGAEGRGALLTGDTIFVVADRRWVSFMYSFPNYIPLSARAIRQIVDRLDGYEFDRLYSAWFDTVVREGARDAVHRSAERYIQAIES